MGFMTELSILNDQFDQIVKDPKRFVEGIRRAMTASVDYPAHVIAQTTVHPSHHADDPRVYFAYRNAFLNLGEYGVEERLMTTSRVPDDFTLTLFEEEIGKAIRMLESSKHYVRYLREKVPQDERPGGAFFDRFGNDHHAQAWKGRK